MKIMSVFLFCCFLAGSTYAQTWDEWFKQKKTQIKYLTQQVAALQVYEGYLSKGYEIAKGGLHTIGNIKNGEFDLYKAFFSSLSYVNPSIQHYSRIADIVALQLSINKQYKRCFENWNGSKQLSSNEIHYINTVFTGLLNNCANDIGDLISLLTVKQFQLGDDQRIQRIDAIYNDMKDKNAFAQSFSNEVNVLITNRQKEQAEVASLQSLFNLK